MSAPAVAPPPRSAGARYYAWLYAPAPLREGTAALLAIEHEILSSAREDLDHSVAHVRLGWWEEEAARLCAACPLHPATIALRNHFLSAALPPPDLRSLPELAARRLARRLGRGPPTGEEASANAALWAEGLFRPLAALAAPRSGEIEPAVNLGRALHAHELAPTAGTHAALREALRALPAALAPALRGGVVWATLALRPPRAGAARGEAFAENWAAWRAARRAQRGRT